MATLTQPKPNESPRPEALVERQLAQAVSRVRFLDVAAAGLGLTIGVLAFALVMVLLDRAFVLPDLVRQIALFGFLAGCGVYIYLMLIRPMLRPVNPYYAAVQVERTLPGAKNSLINYLDLKEEQLPASVRKAIGNRAATDIRQADIQEAFRGRRVAWMGGVALGMAGAILLILIILRPTQFFSILDRTFMPFESKEIATRTRITLVVPESGDMSVMVGQPVNFKVSIEGRVPDPKGPDRVRLRYRHSLSSTEYQEVSFEAKDNRDWELHLPARHVRSGFWYTIAAGDAETPEYQVQVSTIPLFTGFEVGYEYPEYLRWEPQSTSGLNCQDPIEAIQGTVVTLTAHTNREIASGRLQVTGGRTVKGEIVPGSPRTVRFRFPLEQDGQYRIWFTSKTGETNSDPKPYQIHAFPDKAPRFIWSEPDQDEITLPANAPLPLQAMIHDDFGIDTAQLKLRIAGDSPVLLKAQPYREGKSFLRESDNSYPRSLDYKDFVELTKLETEAGRPVNLKEGDVLEYWLEATDNRQVNALGFELSANVGSSEIRRVRIDKPIEEPEQQQQQEQRREELEQEQQQHEQQQDQQHQQQQRKPQQPSRDEDQDQDDTQPDQGEADRDQQDGQDRQPQESEGDPMSGEPKENADGSRQDGEPMPNDDGEGQPGQSEKSDGMPSDEDLERQAEQAAEALDDDSKSEDSGSDRGQEGESSPESKPSEGGPSGEGEGQPMSPEEVEKEFEKLRDDLASDDPEKRQEAREKLNDLNEQLKNQKQPGEGDPGQTPDDSQASDGQDGKPASPEDRTTQENTREGGKPDEGPKSGKQEETPDTTEGDPMSSQEGDPAGGQPDQGSSKGTPPSPEEKAALEQAAKDLDSSDPATREQAREKIEQHREKHGDAQTVKDLQEAMEKAHPDEKKPDSGSEQPKPGEGSDGEPMESSGDKGTDRQDGQPPMTEEGTKPGEGKQREPTPEEKAELDEALQDLKSDDPAKQQQARDKIDQHREKHGDAQTVKDIRDAIDKNREGEAGDTSPKPGEGDQPMTGEGDKPEPPNGDPQEKSGEDGKPMTSEGMKPETGEGDPQGQPGEGDKPEPGEGDKPMSGGEGEPMPEPTEGMKPDPMDGKPGEGESKPETTEGDQPMPQEGDPKGQPGEADPRESGEGDRPMTGEESDDRTPGEGTDPMQEDKGEPMTPEQQREAFEKMLEDLKSKDPEELREKLDELQRELEKQQATDGAQTGNPGGEDGPRDPTKGGGIEERMTTEADLQNKKRSMELNLDRFRANQNNTDWRKRAGLEDDEKFRQFMDAYQRRYDTLLDRIADENDGQPGDRTGGSFLNRGAERIEAGDPSEQGGLQRLGPTRPPREFRDSFQKFRDAAREKERGR